MEKLNKIRWLLVLTGCLLYSGLTGQYIWENRSIALEGGEDGNWNYHVFSPCVIYNASQTRYEMWFGAGYGTPKTFYYPYKIGFATSFDGLSWTMHPDPVLEPTQGEWDETINVQPTVKKTDGTYHMWYEGVSIPKDEGGLGHATSENGIDWIKDFENNPLLKNDSTYSGSPSVLYDGNSGFSMWYSVSDDSNSFWIEHASSENGSDWIRSDLTSQVLTMGSSGDWDGGGITLGGRSVIAMDNMNYLFYSGSNEEYTFTLIGLATSVDGENWAKYQDPGNTDPRMQNSSPVLSIYHGGLNDLVTSPSVLAEGDSLRMWFAGYDGSKYRIMHASSKIEATTSASDRKSVLQDNPLALRNYPTLVSTGTTFEFRLEEPGHATLLVFNAAGEHVETILQELLPSGKHRFYWQPEIQASGIYFYQLKAGQHSETRKLIIK